MLQEMSRDKSALIPKKGFNLVGVDDMATPGEQLYLVANFATRGEAERAAKSRQTTDKLYVYGPEDR
jgi:hypothetical protein